MARMIVSTDPRPRHRRGDRECPPVAHFGAISGAAWSGYGSGVNQVCGWETGMSSGVMTWHATTKANQLSCDC